MRNIGKLCQWLWPLLLGGGAAVVATAAAIAAVATTDANSIRS